MSAPETTAAAGAEAPGLAGLGKVVTGILSVIGLLALVAIIAAAVTLGSRHSFFEPAEEKAAFELVIESTDEELAARPLGELLTLTDQVNQYKWDHPGAYTLAGDTMYRLEKIIRAKQGRGE
jgi:hypothetical protein